MSLNWEEKTLVDVCELITCGVAAKPKYVEEGIPFLSAKNVKNAKVIYSGYNCISEETYKELTKKNKALKGDILYTRVGSYGEAAVIEENIDFGVFVSLTLIKTRKDILNNYYLKYYLNSHQIKTLAKNSITSSGVGNLNVGTVRKFPISLPLLKEQKQIVEILDTAFEAIEKAKTNLEKNLTNTKELFNSKLNEIFSQKGEGWEEKTLGEVCSLFQGLAINAKTKHLLVEKSSLPLLRIKDLRKNTHEQYVSETGFPINALVSEDEILYTRTGNSLGLVFRGRKGILHNNSFKVIPNKELTNDYLYWWLQHDAFTNKIVKLASKAAQPDITHKLFKEQEIIVPPIDKQKEFYIEIVKLNEYSKQLEKKYQQKLNNLEELKKSLLQKAFNGELTN